MKWLARKMFFLFFHDELVELARLVRERENLNADVGERLSAVSRKNGIIIALDKLGLLL